MVASNGLSPQALRETVLTFRDLLRSHQEFVNRLNVYPVPDGDTGTNMALTLESVARELEGAEPSMVAICKAISHGSLMGARGNSGVILSQLLRGLAERFTVVEEITTAVLADALANADALAREAVVRPVEGTILTVARAAAEGAAAAVARNDDFSGVVLAAHRAAGEALEETPELLPQLKQAGVVDAGGAGFLLLLDALRHIVDDIALPEAPASPDHLPALIEHGESSALEELRYEVMYLLEAPDETIKAFKEVWAGIGDSIVVVGGDGIFNCHIHTDDIGAAIEAALDCGRPREIRVTDLHEQVVEERWVREHEVTEEESVSEEGHTTSIIAVVTGDGVGRIFRSLGVSAQVRGGQSMNPSTEQLLEAVEALAAREVIILPNNKNIRAVAEQVDELTDKTVRVVPTNSIVEGFAALLAYDPD
ncbi:MAG: DAK2 domain-containing protein, partial [Actinobacteria bacterium]|nr:DAK2 domain-containing protein [Actinomycetota bacterium]